VNVKITRVKSAIHTETIKELQNSENVVKSDKRSKNGENVKIDDDEVDETQK
jgi:hypothetical protein